MLREDAKNLNVHLTIFDKSEDNEYEIHVQDGCLLCM